MAAPFEGNQIARRVIDELIEFSGDASVSGYMNFFTAQQIAESRLFVNRMRDEAQTSRNVIARLNALIGEFEAFDDPGEVFDKLMGLRDDLNVETSKLACLTDLINETEHEIETKEARLEPMAG